MMFEIKHRWTGAVLYASEHATIREAAEAAIAAKANLVEANLYEANLYEADLAGVNLYGANLAGAKLAGANLYGANLARANLYGANLYGAKLVEANLYEANLYEANLYEADLAGVKADLLLVLALGGVEETRGLLESLRSGEINGSQYEGECCCLVGTLANQKGCAYNAIEGLIPNAYRPAERWFLAIRTGDTPETSQVAKITEGWIEEWLSANKVTA